MSGPGGLGARVRELTALVDEVAPPGWTANHGNLANAFGPPNPECPLVKK